MHHASSGMRKIDIYFGGIVLNRRTYIKAGGFKKQEAVVTNSGDHMSLVDYPKSYQRWCAAVLSDYELIINQFLRVDSWDFDTFKKLVTSSGTILLHNCAVGKGIRMNDQLDQVETVLLQLAKDFWLVYPMQEVFRNLFNDNFFQAPAKISVVKMMVGGFYLVYCMLQPWDIAGVRVHVSLDAKDLLAFYYFRKCLVECSISMVVKYDIRAMLSVLAYGEAFHVASESGQKGIGPTARSFSNITCSKVSQVNNEISFFSNKLLDTSKDVSVLGKVSGYEAAIQNLKKQCHGGISGFTTLGGSSNCKQAAITHGPIETDLECLRDRSSPDSLVPDVKMGELVNATSICASLGDGPVLSIQNLMANAIVDRAMMSEARKKMEGAEKHFSPPPTGPR
ncbi:unnamed protein product [Allacma fusca]|uniref:Uncharacterized protein n=1 Tax=Allacma fusca TaxID=39272 RepID=A0A8J2P1W4_9HEXA|nr:unnamed protein product [Allacma fusca]